MFEADCHCKVIYESDKRIGETGGWAEEGDIVEVVSGRKFPIGMKMVVAKVTNLRFWGGQWHYHNNGTPFVFFYDEGLKLESIKGSYVKIVALSEHRDRFKDEYANVHEMELAY